MNISFWVQDLANKTDDSVWNFICLLQERESDLWNSRAAVLIKTFRLPSAEPALRKWKYLHVPFQAALSSPLVSVLMAYLGCALHFAFIQPGSRSVCPHRRGWVTLDPFRYFIIWCAAAKSAQLRAYARSLRAHDNVRDPRVYGNWWWLIFLSLFTKQGDVCARAEISPREAHKYLSSRVSPFLTFGWTA